MGFRPRVKTEVGRAVIATKRHPFFQRTPNQADKFEAMCVKAVFKVPEGADGPRGATIPNEDVEIALPKLDAFISAGR